jgi:hypothetical protein
MLQRILKHSPTLGFLTIVAAQILFVRSAAAVCPQPHPRVCAEFFKSDAVFVGTVIAERSVPGQGYAYEGWVYSLRAKKIYRGPVRDTIEVFTENSSGRFPLEVGKTYLLFAYMDERRLTIDNCGNSEEFPRAGDAIRQIKQLLKDMKSAPGGDISGRIVQWDLRADLDVAGIVVTARGEGKSYRGVTDEYGWFHIRVPPGKYAVRPESSKWAVTAYDLSYENPDQVVVYKGSCAELQFSATSK